MLPDLSVLLALLLGLIHLEGAPADPGRALLGSLLCVLVGGAGSRMAAGRALQAVERGDLLAADLGGRWITLWAFAAWLLALSGFEWGALVNANVPRMLWLTRYVVLLAPLFVVYGVAWAGRASVLRAAAVSRGHLPRDRGTLDAIKAGLKRNAIALAPLFVLIGVVDGVWLLGELGVESLRVASIWAEAMPIIQPAFMIALILATLPFLPRLIARMLGAQPLAPGPLRELLERGARGIDLQYANIMVWNTGGRVLNAMVVGFTGRSRLIFLTDGLMATLPQEELLAVFFHEAGHAKRRHLPLFLAAFLGLALLFHVARIPMQAAGIPLGIQVLLHLALLWFGLLGWVSRRFERESDVYGAEHAAGVLSPDAAPEWLPGLPAPIDKGTFLMVQALRQIRDVVGYSGSHRHGSVDERMAYLADHAIDAGVRARFLRTARCLRVGLIGLLGVSLVATVLGLPLELAHARTQVALADAQALYERALTLEYDDNKPEAARPLWSDVYDAFATLDSRLGDRTDPVSMALKVEGAYAAGDVAIHGLVDGERAAPHFQRVLTLLDDIAIEGPQIAVLRFECQIELGRIAAWRYAALPVGDAGRDRAAMDAHLAEARRLRTYEMADLPKDGGGKDDKFLAERARLLTATIDAAVGESALARAEFERLVRLRDVAPRGAYERLELAADAQRELERLPPSDK
ncbi:MAG: M48 family metalloprotease [Planctomycetota bacterium]|nr:M48 family metalloprotease [Planctomycetota bacterium]